MSTYKRYPSQCGSEDKSRCLPLCTVANTHQTTMHKMAVNNVRQIIEDNVFWRVKTCKSIVQSSKTNVSQGECTNRKFIKQSSENNRHPCQNLVLGYAPGRPNSTDLMTRSQPTSPKSIFLGPKRFAKLIFSAKMAAQNWLFFWTPPGRPFSPFWRPKWRPKRRFFGTKTDPAGNLSIFGGHAESIAPAMLF